MYSLLKKKSPIMLGLFFLQALFFFPLPTESFATTPSEPVLSKGIFLVATDTLDGSLFHHSVVLIVQHDETGTFGVIINKPTEHPVSDVFPKINKVGKSDVFYMGGPVMHKYVFSLLKTKRRLQNTRHVFEDVFFQGWVRHASSSVRDLKEGEMVRLFAGYSGWAPGQLEREVSQGAWKVRFATPNDLYLKSPATLWQDLIDGNPFLWAYRKNLQVAGWGTLVSGIQGAGDFKAY